MRLQECIRILDALGDCIEKDFIGTGNPEYDVMKDMAMTLWKTSVAVWAGTGMRFGVPFDRPGYVGKIQKYDPSYMPPKTDYSLAGSGAGCYVATAVYGSYDCPEVWTLRRYRDYKLAESIQGRAFIRTYYAISPTVVKLFGDTSWFKAMWRGKLDRMVKRLKAEGYEDTPYNDRAW